MAAHRYWRVRNGGIESQTVIAELEFASSAGGTDLCTGGTALASSSYGGGLAPSQAFNNNAGDRWASSDGSRNCWLGYDFGSGVTHDVVEVRITPSATEGTQCMRWFFVESSDDGSTWSYEWTSYNSGTANTPYTFSKPSGTAPTSARWWAIQQTQNQNGGYDAVIADIALRTSPGGSNVATGGTSRYYPDNAAYAQANAFDQNPSSITYSNEGANPHDTFYWYDLGSGNDATVAEVAITAATGGNEARAPAGTTWCLVSNDGVDWWRVTSFSPATWTSGSQQAFSVVVGVISSAAGAATAASTATGVSEEVDPGETIGTAAGTSAAAGVGFTVLRYPTVGSAAGVGAATAQPLTQGINSMTGQASGLGTAAGGFTAYVPRAGAAAGTSTASGQIVALGTLETVGTASALGASFSGSSATGIISTAGTAAGSSAANGVGTGRQEYVGAASATSSADAGGSYAPTLTVGSAAGVSVVNGAGQKIVRSYGEALGISTAAARVAAFFSGVGTASVTSAGYGVPDTAIGAVGSATATSSAAAVATGLAPAAGEADATSLAEAIGAASAPAVGAAAATSNALGAGLALAPAAGAATGTGTGTGTGTATAATEGEATGTGTGTGAAQGLRAAAGSAGATSAGAGATSASSSSVGYAAGIALATADGVRVGNFAPPSRVVVVPARDKAVYPTGSKLAERVVIVASRDKVVVVPREDRVVVAA